MERLILGLVVAVAVVQYTLWLVLHVDIWRIGYDDPEVRYLPLLTALLPLIGVVVPLWYLYNRAELKRRARGE